MVTEPDIPTGPEIGCPSCNPAIAAALSDIPAMPGYLSADDYTARYAGTPMPWPSPFVDGLFKHHVVACVVGDDGYLLCLHPRVREGAEIQRSGVCACGSGNLEYELWQGRVEIH